MKKIISAFLAVFMLSGCVLMSSCNKEGNGDESGTSEAITTAPVHDDSADFTVPEDLDYGQKTCNVLTFNSIVPEFGDVTEDMGDTVNAALVTRDRYTEDYLGIKLKVISRNGQYADRLEYSDHIAMSVLSDLGLYDVIGSYSLIPVSLSVRGVLRDLNETDYLDFSKKWWASFVYNSCTIHDKTYFMSGDISTNLLYQMQIVAVNSIKLKDNMINEADIYALVDEGQWTLDRFLEIASNISTPDSEGNWTADSFYAVGMQDANMLDSFYIASGMKLFSIEDDNLGVSSDILSNKVLSLYDKVYNAIYTEHIIKMPQGRSTFLDGKELFCVIPVYALKTTLSEMSDPIGILPFPKYDESDSYRTLLSSPHAQYYIPTDANDVNASSAVLETLAYASYQYVTPEVFYSIMKFRYSKDENSSRMFDIIREGSTTDLGILSYMLFDYGIEPASMFRNALILGITNWTSNYKNKFENAMESVVNTLNDLYHS